MKLCLRCQYVFALNDWACPACGHVPSRLSGVVSHAPEYANDGGGFKSEYFSELSRLESENFWFRARNKIILWALKAYKPDSRDFMEVGCGTGFVLAGIASGCPGMHLSASEIFLTGLSYAAKRVPSAQFMQIDARRLPFVEEFDAIGAFDVLEHIEEDEVVLTELYRAIKSNGILLLTVPQHPWLWSVADEHACHVRRYTSAEIEGKLEAAGFVVVRSTSFVTSLLPAMVLSRMLNKNSGNEYNAERELRINSLLNEFFYWLMCLEIFGIRIGINYPFGGSRLIVARKL